MTLGSSDASTHAVSSATSTGAVQAPGTLLEQERVRRGLSVQQTAEALHLDVWIIEAIESNRFLALGAPVYAKGYLRKYAEMLGLAPEVVVARYDALSDTLPEPTPIPVITTTPPPRPKWPKFLGWSLLVLVVAAIGLVGYRVLMPQLPTTALSQESQPVVSSVVAPATEIPATVTPPAVTRTADQLSPVPPVATQTARESGASVAQRSVEQRVAAEVRPAIAAEQPSTPSGASTRLTLQFNDSSWVEVYDASGQRLFYDIGQPGRSRVLTGAAPLNVVIGVASAVSVQVNDQAVVIPRRSNRDSARFVVAADGSVR